MLPELTTYVNEVGQKLAAVADRKLPYEFVVLNNPVPNAWALPGGKIAVNRGLLTELKNESELAAVLGHEIVHAAARHGAKAQERGTLLQAGIGRAQIGAAIGGCRSECRRPGDAGRGRRRADDSAEVRPRPGAGERRVRHEVHEARGLRPGRAPSRCRKRSCACRNRRREERELAGRVCSRRIRPRRSAWRRTRPRRSNSARGGELGKERYDGANSKPLRKVEPAYDKLAPGHGGRAQEGLRDSASR